VWVVGKGEYFASDFLLCAAIFGLCARSRLSVDAKILDSRDMHYIHSFVYDEYFAIFIRSAGSCLFAPRESDPAGLRDAI
jgi:hypothetical protein